MDKDIIVENYQRANGGKIAFLCPKCGIIIKGYEDAIKINRDEWQDGYMHFVCPHCETRLKIK